MVEMKLKMVSVLRVVVKVAILAFFVLFVVWTVKAGNFISEAAAPTADLLAKRDNSAYYQYEVKSPYVYDERDEAYSEYTEAVAKFAESKNDTVVNYGKSNGLVKLGYWIWAITPFAIILVFGYKKATRLSNNLNRNLRKELKLQYTRH